MKKCVLKHLGAGFICIGIIALLILAVMLLWNAVIPTVIGWTSLSYCQAAMIVILCRLLFGGWHHHPGHRHWQKKHREFHRHAHGHLHPFFNGDMKGKSHRERMEHFRSRMARWHEDCTWSGDDEARAPEPPDQESNPTV